MSRWVVVDIGCIECGAETTIEGVYATEAEARSRERDYFEGEDHKVRAFKLPATTRIENPTPAAGAESTDGA